MPSDNYLSRRIGTFCEINTLKLHHFIVIQRFMMSSYSMSLTQLYEKKSKSGNLRSCIKDS